MLRPRASARSKLYKLWILADLQIQLCGHGCNRSLAVRRNQPHLYGPLCELTRGQRVLSRSQDLERGFVICHALSAFLTRSSIVARASHVISCPLFSGDGHVLAPATIESLLDVSHQKSLCR